jgi:2-oxoglutarate ferredoxin oxidoreductase subunit gamma
MRRDIVFGGAGGQGLILAGTILAEAAGVVEGREVVQTQSYGIQARGGASQSTVIISDSRIHFPEVLKPDILLCLSQEAYSRYMPNVREAGLLIIDQDLVNADNVRVDLKVIALPFTAEAEKMNRRIVANVIALGALAVLTGVVKPQSLAKSLPSHLPERNVDVALEALGVGVKMAEASREPIEGLLPSMDA